MNSHIHTTACIGYRNNKGEIAEFGSGNIQTFVCEHYDYTPPDIYTQQQLDDAVALAIKERGFVSHGGDPMFTKAEVEHMLDRLEASKPDYNDMDSYNRSFLKVMYEATIDKAIQAERDALKKHKEVK